MKRSGALAAGHIVGLIGLNQQLVSRNLYGLHVVD